MRRKAAASGDIFNPFLHNEQAPMCVGKGRTCFEDASSPGGQALLRCMGCGQWLCGSCHDNYDNDHANNCPKDITEEGQATFCDIELALAVPPIATEYRQGTLEEAPEDRCF